MPEYPDVELYVERLNERLVDVELEDFRLKNPFLLRSVEPKPEVMVGRRILSFQRIGKRIGCLFEGGPGFCLHLMIAGRLRWRKRGSGFGGRSLLAAWDFADGSLLLNEAGRERRAALHMINDPSQLGDFTRAGLDPTECTCEEFLETLQLENRTLKRFLTDQRLIAGIGNAYSDEILHRAQLSPVSLTRSLPIPSAKRLFDATQSCLAEWLERLRTELPAGNFPEKVTAFRPEMAVHGKFEQPCPRCQKPVARIRFATRETNYCPTCQTGGKLLADRALSKLLRGDWPKTLEELEERKQSAAKKFEGPGPEGGDLR